MRSTWSWRCPSGSCGWFRGRDCRIAHNYCRAWADALDDFHYRVVETPGDGESWDTIATRALGAAPGPDSSAGATNAVDAYVAGPAGFADACRRRLLESGVPETRVKVDSLD